MTDVLIIGGGIAGISAAAYLAPHCKVTLLEAEPSLGYHASGRSAAMYLRDYGNETVRALNYASNEALEAAQVLKQRGMLIPSKANEIDTFTEDYRGFKMQEITVDDALKLCPILNPNTCTRAAYRDDVFDLDTDLLMQGYLRDARAEGAEIHTTAKVDHITKTSTGWQVAAGDQVFDCTTLLNAAGGWVDEIAKLAGVRPMGFSPCRRSIARMPAPGGHDVTGWPFMLGVGEAWFAKPDAGKWLVSPADEDKMAPFDAYADDMVLAEGIARYEKLVSEPVIRVETSWAGLRTFAPDHTLVVGRDVNTPDFFWLGGQGGYGFQSAPAAAQLVADLLTGSSRTLEAKAVTALSPARFS